MSQFHLSDEEFLSIYSRVPRLNVDLVIRSERGILFALRAIEPEKGQWHLPGGTVYKGETIADAALRIAKNETNLDVVFKKGLGYTEFLREMREGVEMHTVSIVAEVWAVDSELHHDANAKEIRYFETTPENTIKEHAAFLKDHGIVF